MRDISHHIIGAQDHRIIGVSVGGVEVPVSLITTGVESIPPFHFECLDSARFCRSGAGIGWLGRNEGNGAREDGAFSSPYHVPSRIQPMRRSLTCAQCKNLSGFIKYVSGKSWRARQKGRRGEE